MIVAGRVVWAVIVPSRPVFVLLVGLALTVLVSGCGGASPETRARQTMRALHGTSTPTPLRAARTAIALGRVTGIDRESAAMLTAEAILPVATTVPPNALTVEAMITTAMARTAKRVPPRPASTPQDATEDVMPAPSRDDQPAQVPPSADTLALSWRCWWRRVTRGG